VHVASIDGRIGRNPETGMNGQDPFAALAAADAVMATLIDENGRPDPFSFADDGRTSGSNFAGMALHIIAQQISTRVALVLFDRLAATSGGTPTADSVLALTVEQLRALGTSHSKASYLRALAEAVRSGELDIDRLDDLTDEQATAQLTRVRGIGPWSAEMFLIHQLRRADILPAGDLGIRMAVQHAYGLAAVPTIDEVRGRGQAWAPFRTYAAAVLWRSLAKPSAPPSE
jgi:DNA-3-methyladenine glycosylase II